MPQAFEKKIKNHLKKINWTSKFMKSLKVWRNEEENVFGIVNNRNYPI